MCGKNWKVHHFVCHRPLACLTGALQRDNICRGCWVATRLHLQLMRDCNTCISRPASLPLAPQVRKSACTHMHSCWSVVQEGGMQVGKPKCYNRAYAADAILASCNNNSVKMDICGYVWGRRVLCVRSCDCVSELSVCTACVSVCDCETLLIVSASLCRPAFCLWLCLLCCVSVVLRLKYWHARGQSWAESFR